MSTEVLIYALLLPLLFWTAYHYYHDRHRPEPVLNLVITLGLGVLASVLAGLGYEALGLVGLRFDAAMLAETNLPGLVAYAVLGIGLLEELTKLLPFMLVVLRFSDFDEPFDGIVYASFLALGFSMAENYHYVNHLTPSEAIARGFAAPAVHIVFSSLWGHHVGMAAVAGRPVAGVALVWLAVAALLHGGYDVIVLAAPAPALILASVLIVAVWIWRLRVIWRLNGARAGVDGGRR